MRIYLSWIFFLPNLCIRPKNPGCHTLYCHSYSEQGIIRHTFSVLSQHVYQQSLKGFGNAWQNKGKIPKRQWTGKEASFIDQHLHPCTSSTSKIFKPTRSSQWLDTHFIQRNTFQIRWFRSIHIAFLKKLLLSPFFWDNRRPTVCPSVPGVVWQCVRDTPLPHCVVWTASWLKSTLVMHLLWPALNGQHFNSRVI